MKFNDLRPEDVDIKVVPYKKGEDKGYLATALCASFDYTKRLESWGKTRSDAIYHLENCLKEETPLVEVDTDNIIKKRIPLGAGNHSFAMIQLALKKLEKVFYIIGGMEQNGGMGTEFDEESDRIDSKQLKSLTEEIVTAISFK